jgi:chromosome segregation ATPase
MSNTEPLSQHVLQQLDTLLERYGVAVAELERMSALVSETEGRLSQLASDAKTLQSENERLRLAQGAGGSEEDRAALKTKINEWVREINTCLARLNA